MNLRAALDIGLLQKCTLIHSNEITFQKQVGPNSETCDQDNIGFWKLPLLIKEVKHTIHVWNMQ